MLLQTYAARTSVNHSLRERPSPIMCWPRVRAVRDAWPWHCWFQCDDSLHFGAVIIWHVGHLKGCWDRWIGMTCKCWYSENWTGKSVGMFAISHANNIQVLGLLEEHSGISVVQELCKLCFSEYCTPKFSISGILKLATNYFQEKVMNGFTGLGQIFLTSWCWKRGREVMNAQEERFFC